MNDDQLIRAIEHDDAYRVIRVLGDGPSGRTEMVRGPEAKLLVRKRIPRELANENAWQTVRSMNHPLLPHVVDLYWLPDELVVILTYVDGITLAELVQSTGPLAARDAVHYVEDLCVAVEALHERGMVHRDVSPNNAVVSGGSARIIDLGNARTYVEGARRDTTRLGTWGYAAPEQYGFAQTDARSDVFGLGSVLGFLLTGFDPDSKEFETILCDESKVPFVLRLVIERARSFEPSSRYQTVADFATAAKSALSDSVSAQRAPLNKGVVDKGQMYASSGASSYANVPKDTADGVSPKASKQPQGSWQAGPSAQGEPQAWAPSSSPNPFNRFLHDWKALSFFGKIRSGVRWLAALFAITVSLAAGFDPGANVAPEFSYSYYVISGIVGAACVFAFAVELQKEAMSCELRKEGFRYIPVFVKTTAKWLAILAFLTVAITIVGAATPL